MTRHRTFRPRNITTTCCVCDVRLEASGSGARCDPILGRYLCSRHGLASKRYADSRLLDLQPRLALLLRARRDLTWIRTMLTPTLVEQLVRFPRRGCKKTSPPTDGCCAWCYKKVAVDGTRRDVRPWHGVDFCRACYSRTRRRHQRSLSQMAALARFVRHDGGAWVLPLLQPSVNEHVAKMLAATRRPRRSRVSSDWI